jgi:Tfp pilus assembly protein PilN
VIPERDFGSRRRPRGRRPADTALLAVAAVLLLSSAYFTASAFLDARHARASLDEVRREIAAAEEGSRALEAPAGPGTDVAARAMWSAEAPPPRVVAALAEMLPRDVRIETLTLRYAAQLEVEMTLTARSAADYDRFLQALEASPVFDSITLGDEARTDTVRASVRVRYHGGEGS